MSAIMSATPGLPDLLADLAYDYDEVGNLVLQTNYLTNVEEQFNYDLLHRLTSREFTELPPPVGGPGGPSAPVLPDPQPKPFETPEGADYSYDALGNITMKTDYANNYEYNGTKHQICLAGLDNALATNPGPHAVTQVSAQIRSKFDGTITQQDYRMAYDANGNMICSEDGNLTVRYDAFNLPTYIQRGFTVQNFNYGPDLQRYRQQSSGAETLYIDKLYERKDTIERYYLGGYLVIERDSAGQDTHSYTHKDRLGSTVAITDDAGDLKVQQGFGPFGKARDEFWEAQDALPGKAYDSRGFTDHEHLDNTRLIHMNGRAYDYNLGRFLSVDPIIQFPENSQSLNPYSYLMNNPMAGTDPTGYMSCSADDASGCIDDAEGLGDGESLEIKATQTGSRIAKTVGSISSSGGVTSVSDNNGNVVGSTSGTTNSGSGSNPGGQDIASLGAPGQAGNQDTLSPRAQSEGLNSELSRESSPNVIDKDGIDIGLFSGEETDKLNQIAFTLGGTANSKSSGSSGREYGALIFELNNGDLLATSLIKGGPDGVSNSILNELSNEFLKDNPKAKLVAVFHNHGNDAKSLGRFEVFSGDPGNNKGDRGFAIGKNFARKPLISFLATPRGTLQRADPTPNPDGSFDFVEKQIGRARKVNIR